MIEILYPGTVLSEIDELRSRELGIPCLKSFGDPMMTSPLAKWIRVPTTTSTTEEWNQAKWESPKDSLVAPWASYLGPTPRPEAVMD